jgi:glycolate oxidase FAD binding subunit
LRTSNGSKAAKPGDLGEALAETVRAASAAGRPLRIVGGGTRAFYGRPVEGEALDLAGHRGVVDYDPTELVITVRAGEPVAAIEAALAANNQQLAFEPPVFGPASTAGGMIASGLAGPARPFAGAVRDAVLGVKVLNGRGEALQFGGVVFKNVAGFDGFRLMAGALGCLGVILEVSLRVAPKPHAERALALELDLEAAASLTLGLMRKPLPLSGACHDGRLLHLRLSGGEAGVAAAAREIGGEDEALGFWDGLRHQTHPFFQTERPLWRLSLPQAAALPPMPGDMLWDWGGSQRWLVSEAEPAAIRAAATAAKGHATLFRGTAADGEVFAPLAPPVMALHRRLKAAFDPAGVFNPGRMYAGL